MVTVLNVIHGNEPFIHMLRVNGSFFGGPPVSMGFATFRLLNLFATDRRNLFASQLLVGVPADPWAKLETPWVSKVQRKLDTKINTKVVTPSIIIPAENYCVQFPCQHASFHAIFSADPKNSQRLLPKWGCFSGCSFFVWWSGFHWQKRMLGFPRKKLAIYRGVGGLQDHTL